MSERKHRIVEVHDEKTGVCETCGTVRLKRSRRSDGSARIRCAKGWRGSKKRDWSGKGQHYIGTNVPYGRPYLAHRKDGCERCSFVPEHPCQLDVHHIDGNRKNNAPSNLQTLRANCHRYVTWLQRKEGRALVEAGPHGVADSNVEVVAVV